MQEVLEIKSIFNLTNTVGIAKYRLLKNPNLKIRILQRSRNKLIFPYVYGIPKDWNTRGYKRFTAKGRTELILIPIQDLIPIEKIEE